MSIDVNLEEIAQLFIEESLEGLDVMESGLLNLDLGAADPELMGAIFRAAHSIKGGGATFGFNEISDFAHHVETLLDEIRQGQREVTKEAVDLALQSVDCLREMTNCLSNKADIDTTRAKVLEGHFKKILNDELSSSLSDEYADAGAASEKSSDVLEVASVAGPAWKIDFRPIPGILKSCNDPLRLFRELATLGELEVHSDGYEHLDFENLDPEECHLNWQLILRGDVNSDQLEEVFAWVRDECELNITPILMGPNIESSEGKASGEIVENPEPATKPAKTVGGSSEATMETSSYGKDSGSIRVKTGKVDALINQVGELVITQSMLSRFGGDFDFTQIAMLKEGLEQLSRNTRELQESVMQIRMMPISFAFARFPRLIRDTCDALGNKVKLQVSGESTELDKTVLEKIGDPLVHLIRNSMDHGLETPEVRVAAGKDETGLLELNAYHEGGNIVIEIIDDGAGINKEKVLRRAQERGLVDPEENISNERLNNLIFLPGFSTVDEVTDLSGRGVGMDVVRRNVADLGGQVSLTSESGKGSKFTIRLPLTLAILEGQLIRVGQETYIISLTSIVETIKTTSDQVNEIAGKIEMFRLRDEYLPVVRLYEMFHIEPSSTQIDDGLLVVAEASGQRIGIFVDELLDQQQVVIKSLEANFRQMQCLSGATILGDGTVALILDVHGLIEQFAQRSRDERPVVAA